MCPSPPTHILTLSLPLFRMPQREDVDASRVIVFGRSLGGAVAIHLVAAYQDKVGGGGRGCGEAVAIHLVAAYQDKVGGGGRGCGEAEGRVSHGKGGGIHLKWPTRTHRVDAGRRSGMRACRPGGKTGFHQWKDGDDADEWQQGEAHGGVDDDMKRLPRLAPPPFPLHGLPPYVPLSPSYVCSFSLPGQGADHREHVYLGGGHGRAGERKGRGGGMPSYSPVQGLDLSCMYVCGEGQVPAGWACLLLRGEGARALAPHGGDGGYSSGFGPAVLIGTARPVGGGQSD